MKELETQLSEYRRRLMDHSKIVKMKEQMAKDLNRVNAEILVRSWNLYSFEKITLVTDPSPFFLTNSPCSYFAGFEANQGEVDETNKGRKREFQKVQATEGERSNTAESLG